MNLYLLIRNWKRTLFVLTLLFGAQAGHAFTFTNADVLVVFHLKPQNDVVFNIGSITNFLNIAGGSSTNVTYNSAIAKAAYNNNLSGVHFSVIVSDDTFQSTSRSWETDALSTTPVDVTPSKFSSIRSLITAVGYQAQSATGTNNTPYYSIGYTDPTSYSYIMTGGQPDSGDPSKLNGQSVFPVETAIPATMNFFEVDASGVTPKPAATLIGTFALAVNGTLTFTRASTVSTPPPQPTITSITGNANTYTISFTTTNGPTYRLRYTTSAGLTTGRSTWTILSSPTVVGDGNTKSLQDTSADANRFYSIEVYTP